MSFLFGTPPTNVDTFEDGDIAEYSGDKGNFSVQTGTVFDGTYSLEGTSDGGLYTIIVIDGIPIQPSAGDTIEVQYYAGSSGEPQMSALFGVQDTSNFYSVEVNNDSTDDPFILREDGTKLATTGTTGDNTPRGEWQRIKIIWGTDGTITAELYNSNGSPQYSISGSSSTYTSGGIGFDAGASNSGTGYWDNYTRK